MARFAPACAGASADRFGGASVRAEDGDPGASELPRVLDPRVRGQFACIAMDEHDAAPGMRRKPADDLAIGAFQRLLQPPGWVKRRREESVGGR